VTIALQGQASALATSITLPSHSAGDLIVIHASNHASTTVPDKPSSSWVSSYTSSAASSVLIAYLHAQNSSMTSGTWTNATHLFATVWRGGANTIVVPEYVSANAGVTINVNYPAQPLGSFKTDALDLALLAYALNSDSTNTLLAPGATTDLQADTDGSSWQAKQYYQLGRTTSWAGTTVQQATSAFYRTLMLTLVESSIYGISSGGIFFRPGMSGGVD
jgi:hypothetical protein